MAVRYGYFNSVNGDRKYNAEDMTMYFKGLVSDGVYQTIGDMLVVRAGNGLTVTVGTGRALVNMHWLENTSLLTLDLGTASVSADIQKLIVLRSDLSDSARNVTITIKDVVNGVIPTPTNNDTVKELYLALVLIKKNATTISQSNIRDYRGTGYCPWVSGLVKQVDVSNLNEQFRKYYDEQTAELEEYMTAQKAAFDNWLASLQSDLTVSTKLRKYQSVYTTTAETTEIPLISNYEDGDVLFVHIGGVLFIEGTEYTIDIANKKIKLKNSVTKDNTITQILVKSVIG